MSDPTSAVSRSFETDVNRLDQVIKNAEAMVVGGLVGLNLSTGKIEFMDDASSLISLGVLVGQSKGDNEHLTGDSGGTYGAIARSGITIKSVAVTGASAITDIGKPVYATDGQTLTLTKPTTGKPIGYVVNWISSTTCDVYLYTPQEQMVSARHGEKQTRTIGVIGTTAMTGTSELAIFTWTSKEHYTIDSLWAYPVAVDSVVAGSQALHIEIATTATTGGVLTLAYTSADNVSDIGTVINATAITAANEVHEGDAVEVVMAASGTGFTAAKFAAFQLWMDITLKAGG